MDRCAYHCDMDVIAGSSKKKAKHAAAQAALNQILGVSNGQTPAGDASNK